MHKSLKCTTSLWSHVHFAHVTLVAKALTQHTKHVGLFGAVKTLVLWQGGERLACHSGLFLPQQGFDVH